MFNNIVYLNRDIDVVRKEKTESQFIKYGIQALRFAAIEENLQNILVQPIDKLNINKAQVSCLLSHLEILRLHGSEDLLVFEDDIDLSTMDKWPVTFEELISVVPKNVGAVQLTYFPLHGPLKPIRWLPGLFSTAAYFIRKEYVKTLVDTGFIDGKWDLSLLKSNYVQPVADSVIYSSTKTMSLLMFGIRDESSTILPDTSYGKTASEWAIKAWNTKDINKHTLLEQVKNFK